MPAPSLFDMAKRRVIRNIHLLTDVGDSLDYRILEPILKKIENPNQLREIEKNSPHLAEDTGELWFAFIKRDIQNWEQKPHTPRNPASWWKVYRKLKQEQEAEIAEQQAALKAALAQKEAERKKNTSTLLDRNFKDPKSSWRSQGSWGEARRDPSNFTYRAGEKKKTLTGTGIIAKIQHKAADYRSQQKLSHGRPATVVHRHTTMGTVSRAPRSMVADKSRVPVPVDNGRKVIQGSAAVGGDTFLRERREVIRQKEEAAKEREKLREREARLKAIAAGQKVGRSREESPVKDLEQSESSKTAASRKPVPPLRRSPSPPPGRSGLKRKREINCFMAPRKK